jgi:hypothetical protein
MRIESRTGCQNGIDECALTEHREKIDPVLSGYFSVEY